MIKNNFLGKLIVFEGLDGSGKSTQSKLLFNRLKSKGLKVCKIDFPQYGKKSAGLVEEYLNGKYGNAKEVGPWVASLFYACDRYDASFLIKKWLKQGSIVISDRYVASNIGHQGGKIKNKKQREKYLKWLHELEYEIFNIPKPDITFILKISPKLSKKMAPKIHDSEKQKKRKQYLGKKVRDIHEKDIQHLAQALSSYLEAARLFPRDFEIIECISKGKLMPLDKIHEIIWKKVLLKINKLFPSYFGKTLRKSAS